MILTQVLVFLFGLSSGILMRIGFERYDDRYRYPMRQFQELRKRIISSLTLHMALLCSPAFVPTDGSKLNAEEHVKASDELRALSADLDSFISTLYSPRSSIEKWVTKNAQRDLPPRGDLVQAKDNLMGLSHAFFLPANTRDDSGDRGERNRKHANRIRQLLRAPG